MLMIFGDQVPDYMERILQEVTDNTHLFRTVQVPEHRRYKSSIAGIINSMWKFIDIFNQERCDTPGHSETASSVRSWMCTSLERIFSVDDEFADGDELSEDNDDELSGDNDDELSVDNDDELSEDNDDEFSNKDDELSNKDDELSEHDDGELRENYVDEGMDFDDYKEPDTESSGPTDQQQFQRNGDISWSDIFPSGNEVLSTIPDRHGNETEFARDFINLRPLSYGEDVLKGY